MSVFRFKQFSVDSGRCAMKVGTDAVILGAAFTLPSAAEAAAPEGRACRDSRDEAPCTPETFSPTDGIRVLDAGCGSGVIALMAAQRLEAAGFRDYCITGVEIDAPASEQAEKNFAASPWSGHLRCLNADLLIFAPETGYDIIVSNPPYYDESLPSPDSRRSRARHCGGEAFSYAQLLAFAAGHLRAGGTLALILPHQEQVRLLRTAASYGLRASRLLHIRPTPTKEPSRLVAEFAREAERGNAAAEESYLTLQDAGSYAHNKNSRTDEYIALTREFYL